MLELRQISKSFGPVRALRDMHFSLLPGEVHALCGENGAGKSTLMNILTGNLQPDSGDIRLDGSPVRIDGPAEAARLGIAIVYQHLSLTDNLSVAENIFANQQPHNRWGLIDFGQLFRQTQQLLDELHLTGIRPRTRVADLSAGQKQMVEVAKALAKKPRLLILDEPTASVTERETQTLFGIIEQLKAEGRSVIYISHRMAEIFRIADRVTVLKDGTWQGTLPIGELTENRLIRLMVGREVLFQRMPSTATAEPLLSVENLSGDGFSDINFTLHRGEILGLAGLVGAGRSEIAQTLFGYRPARNGTVRFRGEVTHVRHPDDAVRTGIAYVPEERKTLGVFGTMSVARNIAVASLDATRQGRFFDARLMQSRATDAIRDLRIVTSGPDQLAGHLSGGNQQKMVLARWLLTHPDVLIVDEPTHGIDMGAKAELYAILRRLAADGKGVLLISSEMPELLTLSDRILVIRSGRLTAELPGDEATEEAILEYAM